MNDKTEKTYTVTVTGAYENASYAFSETRTVRAGSIVEARKKAEALISFPPCGLDYEAWTVKRVSA